MIREEVGLSLDTAENEVLGHGAKVVITKDMTTIIGDGSTQELVNKRVAQIKNLLEVQYSPSKCYVLSFSSGNHFSFLCRNVGRLCRQQNRTMKKRNLMRELQNSQVVLLSFR